jgi:hypothetical protein
MSIQKFLIVTLSMITQSERGRAPEEPGGVIMGCVCRLKAKYNVVDVKKRRRNNWYFGKIKKYS